MATAYCEPCRRGDHSKCLTATHGESNWPDPPCGCKGECESLPESRYSEGRIKATRHIANGIRETSALRGKDWYSIAANRALEKALDGGEIMLTEYHTRKMRDLAHGLTGSAPAPTKCRLRADTYDGGIPEILWETSHIPSRGDTLNMVDESGGNQEVEVTNVVFYLDGRVEIWVGGFHGWKDGSVRSLFNASRVALAGGKLPL